MYLLATAIWTPATQSNIVVGDWEENSVTVTLTGGNIVRQHIDYIRGFYDSTTFSFNKMFWVPLI